MTRILALANEKGGVAKTTSTISLGAALAETGLEVLLIDLDSQANLSLGLAVELKANKPTMVNLLLESVPAAQAVYATGVPRLSLMPASSELSLAERFLPMRNGYEQTLAAAIRRADWAYDYVLIDCPPFLGALTLNALTAADLLIMPTQAEFFSINALRNMMSLVRRVRTQTNAHLTYRLLLTMFDRRNRIHRVLSEQLRETFGVGVLDTIIETDTKLRESPINGGPVIHQFPKSRAALQYRALAQEILAYVKETSTTAQPA